MCDGHKDIWKAGRWGSMYAPLSNECRHREVFLMASF